LVDLQIGIQGSVYRQQVSGQFPAGSVILNHFVSVLSGFQMVLSGL